MSSTAPTKRQQPTNRLPSGQGVAGWVSPFLASSVGSKYLVAVTGLILTGFVITHMAGNLQIFLGQETYNAYARSLKDMGPLLWLARAILLLTLVVHMGVSLTLTWKAQKARPVGYAYEKSVQATWWSRHMALTGLVIFVFTVYHIAHFTLGVVHTAELEPGRVVNYLELADARQRHDAYSMMIYGFRDPVVSVLYIIAQLFLLLHLAHGVASMFQTVGLNSRRLQRLIQGLGWTVALVVCGGNIGIVAGVWGGMFPPNANNLAVERAQRESALIPPVDTGALMEKLKAAGPGVKDKKAPEQDK
jgi:succinate dehydrogenase / fumarate reductase cytochrome b subunit